MSHSKYEENPQKQNQSRTNQRPTENSKAENPSDSLNTISKVSTTDVDKKKEGILVNKGDQNKIKKGTSTDRVLTVNKYDKLFGEVTAGEELRDVQETIDLSEVNLRSTPVRKSVTIKKSSKFSGDKFEPEVEIEDDDDEYVWVEEVIEEEVEIDTDENEIEEEISEEVSEEEESGEKIEEIAKEEQEPDEEELVEEVPEELEIEEEKQIKQEEISDTEAEEISEEEKEEKEKKPKKKERSLKFVKIIKMVKKRKKDVLLELQKKTEMKDKEYEIFKQKEALEEELKNKEEEELRQKEEAVKKEREEKLDVVKSLLNELILLRKKNKALSRSIIEYYRTRKNENVQETEPPSTELLYRYNKRLNLFNELKKAVDNEIVRINEELNELQQELIVAYEGCESGKNELLTWIVDVGKDVIITQTGKPLEESVIQHLVQRLDIIIGQIRQERLIQISLSSQIAENEAALKELVAFEGDLSLIDYEQLRMDNQTFSEKIEERDNELARLRKRVLEIIHTSAHVLEKTDAIAEDIERYNNQVVKMNNEMSELRRKVTELKTTRDKLRSETSKMRKKAGLLTRPKLALDYEQSDLKIIEARNKVESLVKTFKKQKLVIENLRKEIADANEFYDLF